MMRIRVRAARVADGRSTRATPAARVLCGPMASGDQRARTTLADVLRGVLAAR
jgi:hypothetical protein